MLARKLHQAIYWAIIFAALFTVLSLPSVLPVQTDSEKAASAAANNAAASGATVISIFNNNLVISAIAFIPVFGWGYLSAVLWHTGIVIASYNYGAWVFSPVGLFSFIELSVYSFVVLQSVKLVHLCRQWHCNDFKASFALTVSYTFIAMTIALLASAFLEMAVIGALS